MPSMRQRAVALIAVYLWQRARLHNSHWQAAWIASGTIGPYDKQLITNLRERPGEVLEGDWPKIQRVVGYLLTNSAVAMELRKDIELMGPILSKAQMYEHIFQNVVDFRYRDEWFIELFGLDRNVIYAGVDDLVRRLGGLWHVIRKDTSDERDDYNVSLLNIKPINYMRLKKSDEYQAVISHLPHFSIRSRGKSRGEMQEFRGVVIEIDSIIYFIATREDNTPRFCVMSWSKPSASRDPKLPRATHAEGIIFTVNAEAGQISTPVVAQYILEEGGAAIWDRSYGSEAAEPARRLGTFDPTLHDQKNSIKWRDDIRRGKSRVKRYTRSEILEDISSYNSRFKLADLLENLDLKLSNSSKGFFDI